MEGEGGRLYSEAGPWIQGERGVLVSFYLDGESRESKRRGLPVAGRDGGRMRDGGREEN